MARRCSDGESGAGSAIERFMESARCQQEQIAEIRVQLHSPLSACNVCMLCLANGIWSL